MNATESNVLIATKLMGATIERWYEENKIHGSSGLYVEYSKDSGNFYPDNERYHPIEWLKYHSDWIWLMPVVEKIESFGLDCNISRNTCDIVSKDVEDERYPWLEKFESIYSNFMNSKKEAVYSTVVKFTNWLNENS